MEKIETLKKDEKNDLIRLTVKNLGFPSGATTDEIYKKAEKFGLELCPTEVGQHLRLQYPGKEWMKIAMKQIAGRSGYPSVFSLDPRRGGQVELGGYDAYPARRWDSGSKFVFRFLPSSRAKLATG